MRMIDADELIKDRVENDLVRIAAECAPTAYNIDKVIKELEEHYSCDVGALKMISLDKAMEIVKKGGVGCFPDIE